MAKLLRITQQIPFSAFRLLFFSFILLSSSSSVILISNNNKTFSSILHFNSPNQNAFAQYSPAPTSSTGPTISDPNLKVQVVAPNGSKAYTSMAFLGPNDILVLEKTSGLIKRIVDGKMLPKPVLDVAVANKIERGLLGIAVAPNATSDGKRFVYIYYTQSGGNRDADEFSQYLPPSSNSLYRYEWDNNKLINPKQLLALPATPGATNRPDHIGGKVAVGPDGNVYVVIGEVGGHQTKAENFDDGPPADGTGGILRVTPDGQSVSDSPFGDDLPLSYYFAYGIRNSFGIGFDPATGKLWDTENGPDYGDEINLVNPGFNSGWAQIQGYAKNSKLGHTDPSDLVKLSKSAKYSDPEFEWVEPVGPTALTFLNSDKLGVQYKNDMFVGDINNGNIYHFKLSEDRTKLLSPDGTSIPKKAITTQQVPAFRFGQGFGGITDLQVGPDGYLYVLALSGEIFRIVPSSVAETSTATSTTTVSSGPQQNQKQQQQSQSPNQATTLSSTDVTNKVTIIGIKGQKSYDPNPINIKVGDTITWINADVVAHTVTSGKDYNALTSGKLFDSRSIISNGAYSHKFVTPGVYDYLCLFHPSMKGKIIVK